jgi:hypothetical protein
MTIIMTALAAVLLLVLGLAIGAVLGFIRDQGQPRYMTEAQKKLDPPWSKWKESAIAVFGLTFGGLVAWRYGVDLQHAAIWGIGVGAWTALAWAQGHKKGLDLSTPLDWLAMCGTGLAVTLGPAAAMIWHGDLVAGAIVAVAGAMKGPAYWLGYRIRGRGDHPWPHATAIGAGAHGAVAYSVPVTILLLA